MESPCLRIKFTPLLQDIQKDSEHFLEIVPKVTYFQNLDKIQWKSEEKYIEYTVPITYKIILRRKDNNITGKENLNRTYYSCVDLLLSSSNADLMRLGSGDIKKIMSDTLILYNLTPDTGHCSSITLKNPANEINCVDQKLAEVQTENNDITISQKLCIVDSLEFFDKLRKVAVVKTEQTALAGTTDIIQNMNFEDASRNKKTEDQITIDNSLKENQLQLDQMRLKTIAHIRNITNNKIDNKHSLSWTPICSINTDENIVESPPILYSGRNPPLEEIKIKEIDYSPILLPNQYYLYYDIFNVDTRRNKTGIQQYDCVSNRVLPEIRVAKIVQQMEKEIKPLKIILSDIISKCSSLGYFKKKSQKEIENNTICQKVLKKSSNISNWSNKAKSNRVVYSIVFDG